MGKQHKIGVEVDSIDADDMIKDLNWQTYNSLFIIFQEEVAEDPDYVNISETLRLLFVNFYFDQYICFVKKASEGCWVNPFWGIKRHQNCKDERKSGKNSLFVGMKKDYSLIIYKLY